MKDYFPYLNRKYMLINYYESVISNKHVTHFQQTAKWYSIVCSRRKEDNGTNKPHKNIIFAVKNLHSIIFTVEIIHIFFLLRFNEKLYCHKVLMRSWWGNILISLNINSLAINKCLDCHDILLCRKRMYKR